MPHLSKTKCEGHTLQLSSGQVQYLLVVNTLNLEWLDDVRDELRVYVGVPDLGVQQLPDSARKLGANLLRLVTDAHLRDRVCEGTTVNREMHRHMDEYERPTYLRSQGSAAPPVV